MLLADADTCARIGSGAKNLNELERQVLKEYGGTMKEEGSQTYNIRQIPGN